MVRTSRGGLMDTSSGKASAQRLEVAETAARLVAAFSRHDTAAYFDYFADDASFIFYSATRVLTSRAQYEELWARWETKDGFRVRGCTSSNGVIQMLGEDVAVFMHDVATTVETHLGARTV